MRSRVRNVVAREFSDVVATRSLLLVTAGDPSVLSTVRRRLVVAGGRVVQ